MKVVHNAAQQLSEEEKRFLDLLIELHYQNTMRKIAQNTVTI